MNPSFRHLQLGKLKKLQNFKSFWILSFCNKIYMRFHLKKVVESEQYLFISLYLLELSNIRHSDCYSLKLCLFNLEWEKKLSLLYFYAMESFKQCKPLSPRTILFSFLFLSNFFPVRFVDEENIPVKTIVAYAGRNLTLPCPGVNEQSLIDTLTWKTTQTLAKYVANGMPMVQHQRVSNWNFTKIRWSELNRKLWKIVNFRLACYQIIIVYTSIKPNRVIQESTAVL